MAVLLWFSGLCTFYALSNVILGITGTILLPLYFSFCGTEAAVRFSLLLCVHSVLLACIPKQVKSFIPMVQLVLFMLLLFLPINVTPFIAVWFYEKLLLLAEPVFSIVEAVLVVFLVMDGSQSLVDQIEDNPGFVKSIIIGVAFVSYSLVLWITFNMFMDENMIPLENWILLAVLAVSVSVLVICLIQEEGIISDASVVSLMMVCILWAMKQERIMTTNPLNMPKQWTESLVGGKSFLWALTSMASCSLSHLGQAKMILSSLVSPTYLMLAAIRVFSVICLIWIIKQFQAKDEDKDFEDTVIDDQSSSSIPQISPLTIRLVFIFVYTEFLVRSMVISTHHSMTSHSTPSSMIPTFYDRIGSILLYFLYEVRIWRVLQICMTVVTYFYVLLTPRD
ncbi:uncharacterized protein LOC116307720 [Actinia tenebrosa]|uniref:Uncharacterized protein LOC116307720 n=1 Tax=Actinia tenebrosa TaxID=6105 RepID=A0A6P8J2T1_ACTTE|nr:uncharacterized protein LOC116307720 [Actinia tenebrosa]